MKHWIMALWLLLAAAPAFGKVDLVTLPGRDSVELTIYNGADLTLVRESRVLTFRKGMNELQFSWANTLIDPTSLELTPVEQADKIDVLGISYPPRSRNVGVWRISSAFSGRAAVEISYLTSGLSWRAFYLGTLSEERTAMRLQGFVRVTNRSGEDYENAATRVVVGRVNLLDDIAQLARRAYPYGRPEEPVRVLREALPMMAAKKAMEEMSFSDALAGAPRAKTITKQGFSEYFLFSIEGTENLKDGWSRRLPSFEAGAVPVKNRYKYDEHRFGETVRRFLTFDNDAAHELGQAPLPGGMLKVFGEAGADKRGTFEGESVFKYIPVGETAELDLGPSMDVIVEPVPMKFETGNFTFDQKGEINGWEETRTVRVRTRNTRPGPVTVEVRRHFTSPDWHISYKGDFGQYEKVDLDTVSFTLDLLPGVEKIFTYVVTTRQGEAARMPGRSAVEKDKRAVMESVAPPADSGASAPAEGITVKAASRPMPPPEEKTAADTAPGATAPAGKSKKE